MPEPKPLLEFVRYDGGNWTDEPTKLPITETDSMKNVWGDGEFVQKRPGIKMLDPVDFGTGIVSPAVFCEYERDKDSNNLGRHMLAMIVMETGTNASRMAYVDLNDLTLTILAKANPATPQPPFCSLVATRTVGTDTGYVAGSPAWLVLSNVPPEYVINNFGGGAAVPSWCGSAWHLAWFSEIMFGAGGPVIGNSEVAFSQSQRPEQLDPNGGTNDNFLTNPDGDLTPVTALKRAGNDALYIVRPDSIEWITGTAREWLDKKTVAIGLGGNNERSWADCYGALIGFSVQRGPTNQAQGADPPSLSPADVLMLAAGKAVKIGYKIKARIETIAPTRIPAMVAAFWKKKDLAIVVPSAPSEYSDGPAPYGPQTMFVYSLRNGAWWEWELPQSLACSGITTAPLNVSNGKPDDRIIIGLRLPVVVSGRHELLAYFDLNEPRDNGMDMVSFGTSPWLDFGIGRLCTIERVTVRGRQVSGGQATFSIATAQQDSDFANPQWIAVTQFVLSPQGTVFRVDNESLGIGYSRWTRWRIDFPPDGVGSAYTYVNPERKDRGPVKDSDNLP